MNKIKIYTDGSCLKNPGGPGGWCFCILDNENEDWLVAGNEIKSTNNRMELTAVIEALKWFDENLYTSEIEFFTDSLLTLKCATGIWSRSSNLDLWADFDKVSKGKKMYWTWVKAHSGDTFNDLVDQMALEEAKRSTKKVINLKSNIK